MGGEGRYSRDWGGGGGGGWRGAPGAEATMAALETEMGGVGFFSLSRTRYEGSREKGSG